MYKISVNIFIFRGNVVLIFLRQNKTYKVLFYLNHFGTFNKALFQNIGS